MARDKRGRFLRGSRRPSRAGRRRGTPNRVSQAWKELVKAICEDPEAQEALRRACIERPELLFKAAEHAYGKPSITLDANEADCQMIVWPTRVATAEDVAKLRGQ